MDTRQYPIMNDIIHCFSIYMILEIAANDMITSCTKYSIGIPYFNTFGIEESSIKTLLLFQNR